MTARWGHYRKEAAPEDAGGPTVWRRQPMEGTYTALLREDDLGAGPAVS